MSKVLPLEGPHKKHHDHGKDASVPGTKPIPNEHWERHYDMCAKDVAITPANAFDPKRSNQRPCTHAKVNKEDH